MWKLPLLSWVFEVIFGCTKLLTLFCLQVVENSRYKQKYSTLYRSSSKKILHTLELNPKHYFRRKYFHLFSNDDNFPLLSLGENPATRMKFNLLGHSIDNSYTRDDVEVGYFNSFLDKWTASDLLVTRWRPKWRHRPIFFESRLLLLLLSFIRFFFFCLKVASIIK